MQSCLAEEGKLGTNDSTLIHGTASFYWPGISPIHCWPEIEIWSWEAKWLVVVHY